MGDGDRGAGRVRVGDLHRLVADDAGDRVVFRCALALPVLWVLYVQFKIRDNDVYEKALGYVREYY